MNCNAMGWIRLRSVLRSPAAVIVRPSGPFVFFVVSRIDRRMSTSGEQRSLGTAWEKAAYQNALDQPRLSHNSMYVCMYVHAYVRARAWIYGCMYACMYVCIHVPIHVMYVCMHVCMPVCMCIFPPDPSLCRRSPHRNRHNCSHKLTRSYGGLSQCSIL